MAAARRIHPPRRRTGYHEVSAASKAQFPRMKKNPVKEAKPVESSRKRAAEPARGVVAEWTVTILLFLFGTTTLVQAFVIPTGSMEDSLLIGDHLLVDKLAYAPEGAISKYLLPYQDVERGDIAVFRYPIDLHQTFVKRIVGVPGDRIRIVDKQLWVNGEMAVEPYVVYKSDYIDAYRDNLPSMPTSMQIYEPAMRMLWENVKDGEIVVPEGNYFAMGDNRDQSLDSRYWGFVPGDHIIGKPLIIYWSYDAPTAHLQDPGISLEHLRDLALNFFRAPWKGAVSLRERIPPGNCRSSRK